MAEVTRGDINTAIAAVYREVGYVQKKRSAGLNYSYAGEAALIEAIRPAMVENGIFAAVTRIDGLEHESFVSKSGTAMNRVMLVATVRFTHGPTATSIDVQAVGEGTDSGDKAAFKASTGAYKYALRQTFCIETGDDPDSTSSAEYERARTTVPRETSQPEPEATEKPKPEWWTPLTAMLAEYELKSADLAKPLGVSKVTSAAIQKYIDDSGAHWRLALEGLCLSAKNKEEAVD